MSALDVQRVLLSRVEAQLEQSWMPDWADDICREWRTTLELLEQDPASTASFLDWTAKHALFDQLRAARGRETSQITLRNELYELDARYAELGARGVAAALEREGLLEPPLIDERAIARARTHAPGGRAARRGERVRELHPEATRYRCSWEVIIDQRERRTLALPLDETQPTEWGAPRLPEERAELSPRLRTLSARMRARIGLGGEATPPFLLRDDDDVPF